MRLLVIRVAAVVLAVTLTFGGARAYAASDLVTSESTETLGSVVLEGAVGGPSNVVFSRLTIEPDATATVPPVGGSSVQFLIAGSWSAHLMAAEDSVTPEATAAVEATAIVQSTVNGTPIDMSADVSLTAGNSLIIPPGTELVIRNTGSEPAISLSVAVGEQVDAPVGSGFVWQALGDPVALPAGQLQINLSRITVDAGTSTEFQRAEGTEVLDVVSGPLVLVLNPGEIRITRANGGQETLRAGFEDPLASPDPFLEEDEEEGGPGMVSLPPGTPIPGTASGLDSGDAAVMSPGGSRVLRASDEDPAVVVIMEILTTGSATPAP